MLEAEYDRKMVGTLILRGMIVSNADEGIMKQHGQREAVVDTIPATRTRVFLAGRMRCTPSIDKSQVQCSLG